MMQVKNRLHRGLVRATMLAVGTTCMTGGCSPEAIRALIIGLDAAAGQIAEENRDVTFEDWLDAEFDDIFEDD